MRRRTGVLGRRLLAVVPVLLVLVAAVGTGTTLAAFTGTTANTANVVAAKPDWTAPTVTASRVVLASGKVPGTIRPGGTYHVYANASDAGSPASGVQTIVANVSNLTTGASAVPLVAGSYTVGSTNYAWRSAVLTANAGLANGPFTYSHQVADFDGNSRNQTGFPVTVDAVAPTATDVQPMNGGATPGLIEAGDSLVFTFSEALDPTSVLAGWNGTATAVTVKVTATDIVSVRNAADTAAAALGTVQLGNQASVDFAMPSTMTMSGSTITVLFGTPTPAGGPRQNNPSNTAVWTTNTSVTDAVGNALTTTSVNESGSADRDF